MCKLDYLLQYFLYSRKAVLRYKPGRAMKHLSRLSRFQADFQKFTFKKIKKEVDDGCRLLDEPEPSTFSRENIEEFDPAGYYDSLCESFPTYMTSMVAATASGSYGEETMQVLSETAWPGSEANLGGTRPEATNLIPIHNCPQFTLTFHIFSAADHHCQART